MFLWCDYTSGIGSLNARAVSSLAWIGRELTLRQGEDGYSCGCVQGQRTAC